VAAVDGGYVGYRSSNVAELLLPRLRLLKDEGPVFHRKFIFY